MTSSIFSKIIAREIPGHFVYEDDRCVAILDKFPAVKGQTLVIPKLEIDYVFDVDVDLYAHLFRVAHKIAHALDRVTDAERTCLVVEGFEVPHTHLKLYPLQRGDADLAAKLRGGKEASDETLAALAEEIKVALS